MFCFQIIVILLFQNVRTLELGTTDVNVIVLLASMGLYVRLSSQIQVIVIPL